MLAIFKRLICGAPQDVASLDASGDPAIGDGISVSFTPILKPIRKLALVNAFIVRDGG